MSGYINCPHCKNRVPFDIRGGVFTCLMCGSEFSVMVTEGKKARLKTLAIHDAHLQMSQSVVPSRQETKPATEDEPRKFKLNEKEIRVSPSYPVSTPSTKTDLMVSEPSADFDWDDDKKGKRLWMVLGIVAVIFLLLGAVFVSIPDTLFTAIVATETIPATNTPMLLIEPSATMVPPTATQVPPTATITPTATATLSEMQVQSTRFVIEQTKLSESASDVDDEYVQYTLYLLDITKRNLEKAKNMVAQYEADNSVVNDPAWQNEGNQLIESFESVSRGLELLDTYTPSDKLHITDEFVWWLNHENQNYTNFFTGVVTNAGNGYLPLVKASYDILEGYYNQTLAEIQRSY